MEKPVDIKKNIYLITFQQDFGQFSNNLCL